MSTNYYLHRIPTDKRKAELCDMIYSNRNWNDLMFKIQETYGKFQLDAGKPFGGCIHLGKRSGGWKFLWNPNIYVVRNGHSKWNTNEDGSKFRIWIDEPSTLYYTYPLSKEGIWNFINEPDIEVFDEYGDLQDKEEFFTMAINWTTWNNKEAWDSKTYTEYEKSKNRGYNSYPLNGELIELLKNDGFKIEYPYHDFYSDGLRFATYTEFS